MEQDTDSGIQETGKLVQSGFLILEYVCLTLLSV